MREAFVCGSPIRHSRSPLIHRHWLKHHGLEGDYRAMERTPAEFPALLDEVRNGVFVGGNVTLPHKEAAFAGMDRREAAAEAIGAVNTVWRENGLLCGANTDAYGFTANLDAQAPGWEGEVALVLGAGGAARAVLFALLERGFRRILLANRTLARAEEVAAYFGPCVEPIPWEERERVLEKASLLVNTTSLGMTGKDALDLDVSQLPSGATVTDIVYVPLATPLLRAASLRGDLAVIDGLGMLLHQAVPGFERWFGLRPAVTPELRALVVADLERQP